MASTTILSDNGASSGSAGLKSTAGNACSVYWLRLPEHTDMFAEGYVGVSSKSKLRWNQHFVRKENAHLKNAIQKYGWDNIVKQVILISDRDYCLDIEKKLRPTSSIGWNIAVGGGNPPPDFGVKFQKGHVGWKNGLTTPDDVKKKISESLKGNVPWNKGKSGVQTAWNKGVPMRDETKAKVSASKKGAKLSDVTRARMTAARLGKAPYKMTDEVRAKISASLMGHTPWNKGKTSKEQK